MDAAALRPDALGLLCGGGPVTGLFFLSTEYATDHPIPFQCCPGRSRRTHRWRCGGYRRHPCHPDWNRGYPRLRRDPTHLRRAPDYRVGLAAPGPATHHGGPWGRRCGHYFCLHAIGPVRSGPGHQVVVQPQYGPVLAAVAGVSRIWRDAVCGRSVPGRPVPIPGRTALHVPDGLVGYRHPGGRGTGGVAVELDYFLLGLVDSFHTFCRPVPGPGLARKDHPGVRGRRHHPALPDVLYLVLCHRWYGAGSGAFGHGRGQHSGG